MNVALRSHPDLKIVQSGPELVPLYGQSVMVADWAFKKWGGIPFQYNLAVGIVDRTGALRGAFMFSGYNGCDVEAHFWGPGALRRHIVREICRCALVAFNVQRMTVKTRKESVARGHQKIGAVYEATLKRIYGPSDGPEHSAKQYAFYREVLIKLAGLEGKM
jgi:hypothetical protein